MRRFFVRATRRGRRVRIAAVVALMAGLASVTGLPSAPSASAASATSGYWLVGTDGGIFAFGQAGFHGSTGAIKLNQPIVGMAATPDGKGYWTVASDGGIFAFGNAGFFGSTGGMKLNQPIVAMAATRTGKGYWLVASDGGIFAFGDAPFFGSLGAIKLNKPIVDIIPTPSGRGYWMAASDGGIFAFGDAAFYGSTGAIKLTKRIQQMAATPSGKGYWMVAGDGGVFAFGDAAFHGSAAEGPTEKRIVDIAPSATGKGYYITASNGTVFAYGDAKHHGEISGKLAHGIIAMVPMNSGQPPIASNDVLAVAEDGAAAVDVLANDRDPDGGVLVIQSAGIPLHGTATVENGRIVYRPTANYHGTDTFSYTIIDSNGHTAVGLVSVTVESVNDLPRAVDDAKTVTVGQTITIDVVGNDSGFGDGFRDIVIHIGPAAGDIQKSADGRSIIYTATQEGVYPVTYRVFDGDGNHAQAVLTITVTGAGRKPKAVDASQECRTNCRIDVLAKGAALGDNGQIRLIDPNQAAGTFALDGTSISFTPATSGDFGEVSVRYQVVDDNNGTAPEQVSNEAKVTFQFRNTVPTAQTETVGPSPTGVYQLRGQDADNDALTYIVDQSPAPYFNNFNPADGSFRLDGAPPGEYVITFFVFDGANYSAVATYTIAII